MSREQAIAVTCTVITTMFYKLIMTTVYEVAPAVFCELITTMFCKVTMSITCRVTPTVFLRLTTEMSFVRISVMTMEYCHTLYNSHNRKPDTKLDIEY